jgi:hypothetical protein
MYIGIIGATTIILNVRNRFTVDFKSFEALKGPIQLSRDDIESPTSQRLAVSHSEFPQINNPSLPHNTLLPKDTNTELGQGGRDVAAISTPPFN